MNLYIDIGTTNIKGAIYKNKWEYLFYFKHENSYLKIENIKNKIKKINIEKIYICSVKPTLIMILKKVLLDINSDIQIYTLNLNNLMGGDLFLQIFAIQKIYKNNNFHLLSLGTMNVLITWKNNNIEKVFYSLAIDQIYDLINQKFDLLKLDKNQSIDNQDSIINYSFLTTKINNIKNIIYKYKNIKTIYVTGGEYNIIKNYLDFNFIYKKYLLFEGFKFALENYEENDIYFFKKIS